MDQSRITFAAKNFLYNIHYDGCILHYKSKKLWAPLLASLGLARHTEIPVNTILNLESRHILFLRSVRLVANQFSSLNKKPKPVILKSILLFKDHSYESLIKLISYNMESNCKGTNLGLGDLERDEILAYYDKIGCLRKSA